MPTVLNIMTHKFHSPVENKYTPKNHYDVICFKVIKNRGGRGHFLDWPLLV